MYSLFNRKESHSISRDHFDRSDADYLSISWFISKRKDGFGYSSTLYTLTQNQVGIPSKQPVLFLLRLASTTRDERGVECSRSEFQSARRRRCRCVILRSEPVARGTCTTVEDDIAESPGTKGADVSVHDHASMSDGSRESDRRRQSVCCFSLTIMPLA